ncbi:hypothetical protein NMG60_11006432 [Bertholletia excelsa]
MFRAVSNLRPPKKPSIKQVWLLHSIFLRKNQFSVAPLLESPSQSSSSSSTIQKSNNTPVKLSSINVSGIAKSVFLKCSHLRGKTDETSTNPSIKDLLLKLSTIAPEITRKFRRLSELKPEDGLEILLGFGCECKNFEIEVEKVKSLWGIFRLASDEGGNIEHIPQSYQLMAAMLVRVRLFKEIEFLLSSMDDKGIPLVGNEIFNNLIQEYAGAGETQKSILVYHRMRNQGLFPSLSSYRVILDFLIRKNETDLAFRVYTDMVDMGLGLSRAETDILEKIIQLLCGDGKVQEARNLVKKIRGLGMKPSNLVFDAIASGYCSKKDYDDLMKFFVEMECSPGVLIGNKVIFSVCKNFGIERADLFLKELEIVGFCPNEITFGILIGWSCHLSNLKNAFVYLSEMLSRSLKPDVHTFNSLISAVFKEGMWKHAREILDEMHDKEITPNLATFKVILAGYCQARQFDEVKLVINDMACRGLVQLSSMEDPLSKAFKLLGLNPLCVKVKRDNDTGLSKTEFFDTLGNGLYLETDIIKYEETVTGILEGSLIPDFNSLILNNCVQGNFGTAVMMVGKMVQWGQELSLMAFSMLVKGFCASGSRMKTMVNLVEKMPKLTNQLDQKTLNGLVEVLSKKGFTNTAKMIFDRMVQRHSKVKLETCTALITGLCRERNLEALLNCLELAHLDKWSPNLEDYNELLSFLCQKRVLKEALECFENMLMVYLHARQHIFHDFLEQLGRNGFVSTAHALVHELQQKGFPLDQIVYCHLIRGFFKEKMISNALFLLDDMLAKNLVPSLDITILSIPHLCKDAKFEKAVVLKEIALREQSSISLSEYCALINGFCKPGLVGEAAKIVQDILLSGALLDSRTCNILVQGFCQTNNLKRVSELLNVMIRTDLSISILSYSNLVCLMCRVGMLHSALGLKELLLKEANPPYLIIYNILIFYLLRTRNSSFVDAVLGELQEKKLQLDGVTYNFLVCGYSWCKELSRSLQYLHAMMSEGHKPSNRSMRTIITCLCNNGDLRKALELSQEMEARGWVHDSIIQNCITECLLAQGKLHEAVRFLDRMVVKGLIPDNINYDKLIKQFCRYGRGDKAVDLLNIMLKKANIPSSSSYDCLVQYSCTCHKLDQGLDLMTEMLDRNLKPSIKTWNILTQSVCHAGWLKEAERLLDEMVQMGETPTKEMYSFVINRYYCERNLGKASELLQVMQHNGYEPDFDTHWSLISKLSDSNSSNSSYPFLSRLLSESGFSPRKVEMPNCSNKKRH